MTQLSHNFSSGEFACRDGCGWEAVDPLLVVRLQTMRYALGKPVVIVSGRRCPVHNAKVKGASRSRHVHGDAADIKASLRVTERQAVGWGFTGIGIATSGFVTHVDTRPAREPVVWRY